MLIDILSIHLLRSSRGRDALGLWMRVFSTCSLTVLHADVVDTKWMLVVVGCCVTVLLSYMLDV